MDAPAWNGDEDRDYPSVVEHCDQCGCVLLPAESLDGRCSRCEEDYYANEDDAA